MKRNKYGKQIVVYYASDGQRTRTYTLYGLFVFDNVGLINKNNIWNPIPCIINQVV